MPSIIVLPISIPPSAKTFPVNLLIPVTFKSPKIFKSSVTFNDFSIVVSFLTNKLPPIKVLPVWCCITNFSFSKFIPPVAFNSPLIFVVPYTSKSPEMRVFPVTFNLSLKLTLFLTSKLPSILVFPESFSTKKFNLLLPSFSFVIPSSIIPSYISKFP